MSNENNNKLSACSVGQADSVYKQCPDAQKKAYILADNRMALDSGWDEDLLAAEMEELQNLGFDLELTGFDENEVADLFAVDCDEAKEDDFDIDVELEKPCFSQSGDIWHLGKHMVICGDSTQPETYSALLGDTKVNLVCTDPPYLVNLESTSGKIRNDDLDDEKGYEFLKSAFERFHENMAKDASIYVFYATSKARVFHDAYEDAGFKVGAGLVWKKTDLSSQERTGSTFTSRLSGAGEKTASISGTAHRIVIVTEISITTTADTLNSTYTAYLQRVQLNFDFFSSISPKVVRRTEFMQVNSKLSFSLHLHFQKWQRN